MFLQARNVYADARTHGRGDREGFDVGSLRRGWLVLAERFHERGEVLEDLFRAQRGLSDDLVNVARGVVLEGDLTALQFFNHLGDVWSDRFRLWVWHDAFWTQDFCDLREFWHHVRRCDGDVEGDLVRAGDFFDQFFSANEVSACVLGFLLLQFWNECGDTLALADAVWKNECRTDLLVALFDVDAEVRVNFDRSVEFRCARFFGERDGVGRGVELFDFDFGLKILKTL